MNSGLKVLGSKVFLKMLVIMSGTRGWWSERDTGIENAVNCGFLSAIKYK